MLCAACETCSLQHGIYQHDTLYNVCMQTGPSCENAGAAESYSRSRSRSRRRKALKPAKKFGAHTHDRRSCTSKADSSVFHVCICSIISAAAMQQALNHQTCGRSLLTAQVWWTTVLKLSLTHTFLKSLSLSLSPLSLSLSITVLCAQRSKALVCQTEHLFFFFEWSFQFSACVFFVVICVD